MVFSSFSYGAVGFAFLFSMTSLHNQNTYQHIVLFQNKSLTFWLVF